MSSNIVLSSDGTGNSGGKDGGTNVWRMHLAIDRHDHEHSAAPPQLAFHDDGVGTSDLRLLKAVGGAFGWGLGRNIRELYAALVRNYTPGDAIYLFGFSRGAFTVRSLAGFIAQVGVIDAGTVRPPRSLERWVYDAYAAYRKKPLFGADPVGVFKKRCADEGVTLHGARIRFLGVWDTVDAVGVPADALREVIYRLSFLRRDHVHRLTDRIDHACHAVAMDDERATFSPLVWDPTDAPDVKVEQVWFAGVHSNVGGGYPKAGVASVALYWMMKKAARQGLRIIPEQLKAAHDEANVHSKLYDSRVGAAAYYRYRPRNIGELCARSHVTPAIHVTALDRIARATDRYAPVNLPVDFQIVTTDGDEPGKAWIGARVSRYAALLGRKDSRQAREDAAPRIARVRFERQLLYGGFLTLSWVFAWAILAIGFERPWSMGVLLAVSDALAPVLGWANPVVGYLLRFAGGILSATVGLALPGFLEGPVRSLDQVSELTALMMIAALLLLWRRQVLIAKMRRIGVDMWRAALRDAP